MLRILLAASFIGGTVGFASAGPEPEHVDCTSLAYHIDRDINDTTWVSENQAAGHLETYMALCPETASGTKLAIDGGGLFTILSYLLPSDVSGTHLWDEKYSYHGHEHDEHVGGENQVIFGGACGTVAGQNPCLVSNVLCSLLSRIRQLPRQGGRGPGRRHSGAEHARLRRPRRYGHVR